MGSHVPNRQRKGTPEGGRFAPGETPAAVNSRELAFNNDPNGDSDPVADLYDKMTYDAEGFDAQGYDRDGFDKIWIHRNGDLFGDDGYNRRGFNEDRIHRNGTEHNDDGFDWDGRHRNGTLYDDDGHNYVFWAQKRRIRP